MQARLAAFNTLRDLVHADDESEDERDILGPSNLPWSRYLQFAPLGVGKFAETYLGTVRDGRKGQAVLKLMPASKDVVEHNDSSTDEVWQELRHLRKLTHLGRRRISPNLPLLVAKGRSTRCAVRPNPGVSTVVSTPCVYALLVAARSTLVEHVREHALTKARWQAIVLSTRSSVHQK